MANPTYPFDQKILELIATLTETDKLVNFENSSKALDSTYEIIREKVSRGAYEYVSGEIRKNDDRPSDYQRVDRNSWKRAFGHNDLGKGSECKGKLLIQIPKFLEFDNWDDMMDNLDDLHQCVVVDKRPRRKAEDVSEEMPYTNFSHLRPGDELDVYWPKGSGYDRPGEAFMKIRYMGNFGNPRFHINAVQNCSLKAGEDFDAQCLEEGKIVRIAIRRPNTPPVLYSGSNAVTSIEIFRKER